MLLTRSSLEETAETVPTSLLRPLLLITTEMPLPSLPVPPTTTAMVALLPLPVLLLLVPPPLVVLPPLLLVVLPPLLLAVLLLLPLDLPPALPLR